MLSITTAALSLLLAAGSSARPTPDMDMSPFPGMDPTTVVLQYALTLEHLEDTFYRQGLANLTADDFAAAGYPSYYDELPTIASDEKIHVALLTSVLGDAAVKEATYAFPCTAGDAKCFVTLSSVLEGVGVSAYIGAAGTIVDKTVLTVAGTILAVEARHSSYLRGILGQKPCMSPLPTQHPSILTLLPLPRTRMLRHS